MSTQPPRGVGACCEGAKQRARGGQATVSLVKTKRYVSCLMYGKTNHIMSLLLVWKLEKLCVTTMYHFRLFSRFAGCWTTN